MKKYFFVLSLLILGVFGNAFAQNGAADPNANIVIKPTMVIDNLVFVSNALNTIEISGSEVDAFLQAKNFIDNQIKKLAQEKKTPADTTTFDIPLGIAKNLLNFLGRATIPSANAAKYKSFVDSLVAAAQAVGKTNGK